MLRTAENYLRGLAPAEKKALAAKCGISRQTIYNLLYDKGRKPGVGLAIRIEEATGAAVSRRELRPDINWELIEGASANAPEN